MAFGALAITVLPGSVLVTVEVMVAGGDVGVRRVVDDPAVAEAALVVAGADDGSDALEDTAEVVLVPGPDTSVVATVETEVVESVMAGNAVDALEVQPARIPVRTRPVATIRSTARRSNITRVTLTGSP